MEDCRDFIGDNWIIKTIEGNFDFKNHRIKISSPGPNLPFTMECLTCSKQYGDFTCKGGQLIRDDGLTSIALTLGAPKQITYTTPLFPGSWTAEDNSGTGGETGA